MSITVRLVLASTLMLFLELSLIRWSSAQVVHLSYFSNFILLGSFLGIGLGFLRASRSKRRQPIYSVVAMLAYVAFLSTFPVAVNREQESVIYFTSLSTSGPPIWVTLPVISSRWQPSWLAQASWSPTASPNCRGWSPTAPT